MIDTILTSRLSWLIWSPVFCGGMIATAKWFTKQYKRRSGMTYQIAVTFLSNEILN